MLDISSWARDQTHHPCIARQSLNHSTPGGVPALLSLTPVLLTVPKHLVVRVPRPLVVLHYTPGSSVAFQKVSFCFRPRRHAASYHCHLLSEIPQFSAVFSSLILCPCGLLPPACPFSVPLSLLLPHLTPTFSFSPPSILPLWFFTLDLTRKQRWTCLMYTFISPSWTKSSRVVLLLKF